MLLKDFFYFTVPIFAVFVMSAKSFRLMSTRGWHRNLFQLRDKKNIIALDFDGVICASSGESSFSSIVAAKKYWPDVCDIQMVTGNIFVLALESLIYSRLIRFHQRIPPSGNASRMQLAL